MFLSLVNLHSLFKIIRAWASHSHQDDCEHTHTSIGISYLTKTNSEANASAGLTAGWNAQQPARKDAAVE